MTADLVHSRPAKSCISFSGACGRRHSAVNGCSCEYCGRALTSKRNVIAPILSTPIEYLSISTKESLK